MRYIIRQRRSITFMFGVTLFLIIFTGALGGFIYRDMRQSEEAMTKAIDYAGAEAKRRAERGMGEGVDK